MYENVDRILKTKICIARSRMACAFLFDLAASGIWPINQHTVRHGSFSYLMDNLLSVDIIILHNKFMKNFDLALNQEQFKEECLKKLNENC